VPVGWELLLTGRWGQQWEAFLGKGWEVHQRHQKATFEGSLDWLEWGRVADQRWSGQSWTPLWVGVGACAGVRMACLSDLRWKAGINTMHRTSDELGA